MIRVLVVDDDYHVAQAHALSVARIEGFAVVGEAHTAAEAVDLVGSTEPDLLLLDMYLPDFSGLELVRRLAAREGRVPDFLLVTAARDIESVRTAMQLGAFYYLVKPFSFAALREQLEAYRTWTERLGLEGEADQQVVDTLFSLRSHHTASGGRIAFPAPHHGPGARDRHVGRRVDRGLGGRRGTGSQSADRPAVPRIAGQQAAARPRPQLWHHRPARAPLPAQAAVSLEPRILAPWPGREDSLSPVGRVPGGRLR